jgi:indolepyruvate ferredoxin oxidoreductase beta subunit
MVYSPLVGAGEVDVLLAFEKAEALRNLKQLRPEALALINLTAIEPVTVTSGGQAYPDDDTMRQKISQVTSKVIYIDGEAAASELGNIKAANVVLLGALSALMEREGFTGPELPAEIWLNVITSRVPPKFVELNRQAFNAGREIVARSG